MQAGMRLRLRRAMPTGLLLVAVSCAGQDAELMSEAHEPASSMFHVDSVPMLSIGSEADPDYEFSEIVAFERLSSGRWFVADRGTSDLRFYDESGRILRRVGGRGEGPGEYQYILAAWKLPGDGVLVHDAMLRRLTMLDVDGNVVAIHGVPAPPAGWTVHLPVGLLDASSPVASAIVYPPCVENRVARDTIAYFRLALGGAQPTEIARVPGGQRWHNVTNLLRQCLPTLIPFAGPPIATARHGRLYIARRDRRELTVLDPETSEVKTLAGVAERVPLTQSMIDTWIDEQVSATPRDERGAPLPRSLGWAEYERRLRETPYPDSLPAASQLLVGDDGRIWLAAYPAPDAGTVTWWVIDAEEDVRQRLELPANYRLTAIGPDYIAGVTTDSFDVQRVVVHRLSTSRTEQTDRDR